MDDQEIIDNLSIAACINDSVMGESCIMDMRGALDVLTDKGSKGKTVFVDLNLINANYSDELYFTLVDKIKNW